MKTWFQLNFNLALKLTKHQNLDEIEIFKLSGGWLNGWIQGSV